MSNRIAFGVRSDRVRCPIGLRSVSDWIAFAVRSDCVRRPIGLRSPSDQIAFAIYSYKHRMYTLSTKSDCNTYCCLLRRPETSATFLSILLDIFSSYTERNPIGHRTQSDWTPNAIRLDSERRRSKKRTVTSQI